MAAGHNTHTLVVVTLVLIGYLHALEAPTSLWEPGREVKYVYTAHVSTTTMLPVETTSTWMLTGDLNVQATSEISVIAQLQDATVIATNAKKSASDVNKHAIPVEAEELYQPFKLHYNTHGLLTEMIVQRGDNPWAVNMKRGIATLLQLDLSVLHCPASNVTEEGLHGKCKVQYLIQNHTANITVTKCFDSGECSGSTHHLYSSAEKLRYATAHTPMEVILSNSEKMFVVKDSPALQEVKATGSIMFQPCRTNGEMFHIDASQTLKLTSEGEITNPIEMNGEEQQVPLNFQQPNGDISLGRSPPKQEDLLIAVTEMLEQLGDNLEQRKLETNPRHLHTERVAHVLYFLSLLNHTSLHQLYTTLAVGTSYRQETIRNLLMEVLPQVGSQDAVLLIRDLITTLAIKNDTAVNLLMSLPFYVRNPTEDLLAQLEVLLNEKKTNPAIYRTAVLSFATLVSRACNHGCSIDMMEKYVRRYLDLLTGSEGDYSKQMLYIHALSNFDQEMIFQFVRPLIENKANPRQLRFIAIWATSSAAHVLHNQMSEVYWPILKDRGESIEIRSAALMMLIMSRPTVNRFYSLYWFMLGETRNTHLYSYWYTTLQSLIHSKYPSYVQIGEVARKVARYFPKKDSNHWLTGNYILDYANDEHGFGSLLHACIIANLNTGQPDVFYVDIGSHTDMFSFRQFSLYLRVEGVDSNVKSEIMEGGDKLQLTEILNKLNLPKKSPDPVHIEIAVKMQNKVILVQYINDTSARSLSQVLQAVWHLTQMGIDLNQQDLEMPFLMEQIHATDVGTPALLRITATTLISLRANLNLFSGPLRSVKLDSRVSLSLQTALMSYNPVLNMWHRVRNSRHIEGNFPLNVTFSVTPPVSLVLTFQQEPDIEAGIVAHVQTDVSVQGRHAEEKLKTHCSTCIPYHIVTHTSDYPQEHPLMEVDMPKVGTLSVSMLHCEHSMNTLYEVIRKADGYVNSKILPQVYPWLKLLQFADFLLLVPPPGSCGVLVRLSPSPGDAPSELQAILQFGMDFLPVTDQKKLIPEVVYGILLQLNHQSHNSSQITNLMNLKAHFLVSSTKIQMGMDMHVILKEQFQVCLTLDLDMPEVQRGVSAFTPGQEIQMEYNVTWGHADNCPVPHYDAHSIEVAQTGGLSEEQLLLVSERKKWPYSECWHDMQDTDKWGTKYAPLSPACNKVAQELHTLRQYSYTNSYSNFQSTGIPWLAYALGLPALVPTSQLDTLEIQLDVPEQGLASLTYQQHKTMLSDMSTAQVQLLLTNTRSPAAMSIANTWGLRGTCTVTTKSVQTFDEAVGDLSLSHCYTLAAAKCLQDTISQFGVFVKRVQDAQFPLAVDVFAKKDHIEILPHKDKLSISVNGVVIENATEGFQQPSNIFALYDFKVVEHSDGLVVVDHKASGVYVEYYGHFTAITITGLNQGSLCGLCGDHNNDEFNDLMPQYSIPCDPQT